jgi:LysM repeat protein
MARIIRLTERDLTRIVRRVIKEQDENDSDIYTVKPGDNLTKIAKKFDMTVSDILKMNPQIKDANKIYPGDKIISPVLRFLRMIPNPQEQIVGFSSVPRCEELLVQKEAPKFEFDRRMGESNYMDLEITGNVKLYYNTTDSSNMAYKSVLIVKDNKPFCKIPVYRFGGDCTKKMQSGDYEMLTKTMSASLVSPVSINTTGTVSPDDSGMIINDNRGYFCTVPTTVDIDMLKDYMPESRRRRGYRY